MSRTPRSLPFALFALAATLGGCGGQGRDDTLVDGAVDRPTTDESRAAAEGAGPPMPSSNAAGPAGARSGTDAPAGAGAPGAGSAATPGATLAISTQGAHGAHVTDSGGMALYLLEGDRDGSKCVADCLVAWPPVLMGTTQPSGAPGLQGAMVSTVTRPDGARQLTYNGQPLYRYAADGGAGKANGHGVRDRYGVWYLVSPQGGAVVHGGPR